MNGEANGTMEEVTVNSLHEPDLNLKKEEEEKCNTDSDSGKCNETDQSLAMDNLSETDQKNSACLENGSNKMEEDCKSDKSETETLKEPLEENSNNDTIINHNSSSSSNESDPESGTSLHGKSETLEDNEMHNIDEKSKDEDSNKKNNVDNGDSRDAECHEIDSDGDSDGDFDDDDDDSVSVSTVEGYADLKADTVSIDSDSDDEDADDTSQESQIKDKDNDIIILDNDRSETQNGKSQGSASPEVHEIGSDNDDDCILTDEKSNSSAPDKTQLRRSSRAIKRKKYDLEDLNNGIESDVEEVEMDDPLGNGTKSIIINDTRSLLEMTSKKMKLGQNNQKNDPTIVIIDSQSGKNPLPVKTSSSNTLTQNIYQTIVARGTTVTPVTVKNSTTQNSPQRDNSQTSILPSLTDDMFVVEAPSFIVPYVYEKPSLKPFREFVDKLGKELDEQAAKEEKLRSEKAQQDKENRDKLRQERKDRGEEVSASEEEVDESKIEDKKKRKAERQEKRRRRNASDDDSWDGESSDSSESDDDTVILKNKVDSMEVIKDVAVLTADKICSTKSDNYFDCSLGKFFVDIGLNLVQEFVQSDLLKQQNRKLIREKKSGQNTRQTQSSIVSLMKNLEFSKENNAPYAFSQKKCEFCSFRTESVTVLHHHLETPHMKNNLYKCNFCEFEVKSPHDILSHMEIAHQVRGRLERAPAYHQCCNCPFEDNGKGKLARHQLACAKKFKPDLNLAPPIEWEPPAKIPKVARARSNMMGVYQGGLNRPVGNNLLRTPINIANMMPGAGFRPRGRSPLAAPARPAPVHGLPIMRSGILNRPNAGLPNNFTISNNMKSKSMHQPSISITPLPRQPQPAAQQSNSKSTFVICEICDGYIKDLEQLRNHMQWIHKVKIHPKMIYNRPPLNCQKCQFRFFTDQGLERHLLGSHGLVTSSMQEAANKGKDAGRCPVCGRVYQWKLLNHVSKDHNLTLKPAHLSYKCTVCTATFGMYKQFENHVYSSHSVVAKRVMDKNKTASTAAKPPTNDSLLKPLKINDEITIIPQPVKSATSTKTK